MTSQVVNLSKANIELIWLKQPYSRLCDTYKTNRLGDSERFATQPQSGT